MKTTTKTFNIYSFSELSETAKDKARQTHQSLFGYAWGDETLKSLEALSEHFGGKLSDYSIDYSNSSYSSLSFQMPEMEPEEISSRLDAIGSFDPKTLKGHGDCVLTGYLADEWAIDGFREAWMDGERDLERLMDAAGKSWLAAVHSDYEDQYSDEIFGEFCEMNEYQFTEDGSIWAS